MVEIDKGSVLVIGADSERHEKRIDVDALGLTESGFRVRSVDHLLDGTQWESQIKETITPELHHFAKAGVGAVVGALPHGLSDDDIQGLFETQLFGGDLDQADLAALTKGRLDKDSSKLFNRGVGLILAVQAASEMQNSSDVLTFLEFNRTQNDNLFRLPLTADDAEESSRLLGEAFSMGKPFFPDRVEMSYAQPKSGEGLELPRGFILAAPSRIHTVDEQPTRAMAFTTYNSTPFTGMVEVHAERGIIHGAVSPDAFKSDPDFAAAKGLARVARRVLNRSR